MTTPLFQATGLTKTYPLRGGFMAALRGEGAPSVV